MRRTARRALAAAGIAAGAAAVVAAVVMLPGMRGPAQGPARPGTTLAGGRVAVGRGLVYGRQWRVNVSAAGHQICAGVAGLRPTCAGLMARAHLHGIASLSGAEVAVPCHCGSSGPPIWNSVFGTVRSDVTRVDMKPADGQTVSSGRLPPPATGGLDWSSRWAPTS